MTTDDAQATTSNTRVEDEDLEALEREAEEAECREEEEARRQAEERARRQAARQEQLKRARAEAEEKKKREEEERKRREEEERRKQEEEERRRKEEEEEIRKREEERKKKEEQEKRRMEEEEARWAEEMEEEGGRRKEALATEERARDKGKWRAEETDGEVEVIDLDDDAEGDDEGDGGDGERRRPNRVFVKISKRGTPGVGSSHKRQHVKSGKAKLGGDRPCQRCVDVGRTCKPSKSSTVTRCASCTCQKLRCKEAVGESAKHSVVTLRIPPARRVENGEPEGWEAMKEELATLRAELAIEREARREERGRLLDTVEQVALAAHGTRDAVCKLLEHLEMAGKIGDWKSYDLEMRRRDEESQAAGLQRRREAREQVVRERDKAEGVVSPWSSVPKED